MINAQTAVSTDIFNPWMPELVRMGGWGMVVVMLAIGMWAFWKRKVITPETFNEMKESRDLERKRADTEAELRRKADEARDLLIEQSRITVHLLESIDEKASRRDNH